VEKVKNRITAIILNYNRDKNIPMIVDAIRKQSIPANVWVWDNAGLDKSEIVDVDADVYMLSTHNFGMHPRIMLSGMVQTDFIWWNDDDRMITDPELFAKLIQEMKDTEASILGINGKDFDDVKDWKKPYQDSGWVEPGPAKFVNTGFSFIDSGWLLDIPFNLSCNGYSEDDIKYGDDMIISNHVGSCFVSEHIQPAIKEIDECGIGLSHQTMHMDIRNKLCRIFWGPGHE